MSDEVVLPSLDEVIEDPSSSWWLKESLTRAMIRDPVDALNDSLLLAALLERQMRKILELDNSV
jgi:hypothetical protein